MSELLHQNSKGVKIVREDYKKRSQVKVFSEFQGKRYTLHSYRFVIISLSRPKSADVYFLTLYRLLLGLDCLII